MSDYSEQGAVPVDDAAVADPPTVEEVLQKQCEEFPDQAGTARRGNEVDAAVEAGGTRTGVPGGEGVAGPNPA